MLSTDRRTDTRRQGDFIFGPMLFTALDRQKTMDHQYPVTTFIECEMFSDDALSGCFVSRKWGRLFWTAGYRATRNSAFVWRVTSTVRNNDVESPMSYTNWYPGEPNDVVNDNVCVDLPSVWNYKWADVSCSISDRCSVCELDI